jgi:hypothetical protein
MKQIVLLYSTLLALAWAGARSIGYEAMILVGYGAVAVMALLISLTFLWLWHLRATPLALGMSLSWAGSGLTIGLWWILEISQNYWWSGQAIMVFLALSLLMSGAILHFAVIQGSFGLHGLSFVWPAVGALGLSLAMVFIL